MADLDRFSRLREENCIVQVDNADETPTIRHFRRAAYSG
jgi:hypothetical protein